MEVKLRADTYREHMDILAKEDLGLDPSSCSGLMTVASMDNSAISTLAYDDFSVTHLFQSELVFSLTPSLKVLPARA